MNNRNNNRNSNKHGNQQQTPPISSRFSSNNTGSNKFQTNTLNPINASLQGNLMKNNRNKPNVNQPNNFNNYKSNFDNNINNNVNNNVNINANKNPFLQQYQQHQQHQQSQSQISSFNSSNNNQSSAALHNFSSRDANFHQSQKSNLPFAYPASAGNTFQQAQSNPFMNFDKDSTIAKSKEPTSFKHVDFSEILEVKHTINLDEENIIFQDSKDYLTTKESFDAEDTSIFPKISVSDNFNVLDIQNEDNTHWYDNIYVGLIPLKPPL